MKTYVEIMQKVWRRGQGWSCEDCVATMSPSSLDEINEELEWWTFENTDFFSFIADEEANMNRYLEEEEDPWYYFHDKDYQYVARVWDCDDDGNVDCDKEYTEFDNGCWLSEGYQIWRGDNERD